MRSKEEVGLGGIHRCCRPLYLCNCTSWFIGFREVLCVSFAAALGIWGTSFPHDQYSERFTSRAKACSAWIWLYIFIYLFFLFDFLIQCFFCSLLYLTHMFFFLLISMQYSYFLDSGVPIYITHLYSCAWCQKVVAAEKFKGLKRKWSALGGEQTLTTHGSIYILDRTA